MTKKIMKNIKIKDIPSLIIQLNLSPEKTVNLTIESADDDLLSIMDRIGKTAQEKGINEEQLAELIEYES
ncbi:hypothetical protein [Dapis sp. BLCC M126]|uniref:hypothetical protein n=1 Tax=Dapis sp. BLCC M126 TaxID=3400189 RepID=UPI003CEA3DC0